MDKIQWRNSTSEQQVDSNNGTADNPTTKSASETDGNQPDKVVEQPEDIITCNDFNEEDFDEGPGPGLYIPQPTVSKP